MNGNELAMLEPEHVANTGPTIRFTGQFRRYQTSMLGLVATHPTSDRCYHLVAPPGSGKTIIGLELIGRFARPAVVFAPTTTIQGQWLDKLEMFTGEADEVGSRDATDLGYVTALTYQVISTPDAASEAFHGMAITAWAAESADSLAMAADPVEAMARIERMADVNPDAYRDEMAKRVKRVRHDLLAADGAKVYDYLHPNARALIDRIVAAGVGTVVLDECHHLLDYWAIVLRALIARLDSPYVVGLTATLPSPEDNEEYENYTSLLGDVDFEIPTPAVIKEGDLAPFRDLAWWVKPTEAEATFLKDVHGRFLEAVETTTTSPGFLSWLGVLVADPPPGVTTSWADWAADHDELARASVTVGHLRGLEMPSAPQALLQAMDGAPPLFDDWLILLERFGLECLKVSDDPADHVVLADLRRAIAPFGLTLTERGLRRGRSVVDLVLSFSESKCWAAADILDLEHSAMGEQLRAVVVTDFERLGSGVARSGGVLDRDAGSAFQAFEAIALDPRTEGLKPILVTGSTVRTTKTFAPDLRDLLVSAGRDDGLDLDLQIREIGDVAAVEADAEWRPGVYVGLVGRVFETGASRVLIGTRALLGEGWDSPSANTLIDLTSVTTATSVQQLRGRILRLDPAWPTKVAHAYDVVCLDQSHERGDVELTRLMRRHSRTWGIVPPDNEHAGDVVRGLAHVDPKVIGDLAKRDWEESMLGAATAGLRHRDGWRRLNLEAANARVIKAVGERARVRDLWRVGEPYDNAIDWFSSLRVVATDFRTAATVRDTLRALLIRVGAIIASGLSTGFVWGRFVAGGGQVAQTMAILAAVAVVSLLNAHTIMKLLRSLLVDQPPDAIVGDAARSVLGALRETNLISGRLTNEMLAVDTEADGSVRVAIRDRDAGADAATFARALDDLFGPVTSPRYLISRDDGRMPALPLQILWGPIRSLLRNARSERPTYLPVPDVLGANRERADAFIAEWHRWVGGGQLIPTRSAEGRQALHLARAVRRRTASGDITERWR